MSQMTLALDAMGGDFAPAAPIAAAKEAAQLHPEWTVKLVITEEALKDAGTLPENVVPVICGSVMAMDEDIRALLKKKDSSIWMATDLVKKGEADAIISAGSTGAQMACASLLLSRAKGVERPAIAAIIPTLAGPRILLDAGANADCEPAMLAQFAVMGAVYARQMLGVENPRVGILANGTESHKGNKLTREAYTLIEKTNLNFIGNMEGRDLLTGEYEVMVADGMSGNIAIKTTEGAVSAMMKMLKTQLTNSTKHKLGALLIKDGLKELKKAMDYEEHGGAPLLGVGGVSIVCHGSSGSRALVAAMNAAAGCVEKGFVAGLEKALEENMHD